MKTCLIIGFVLVITQILYAAEPKITETENGYIVEYSGTPEPVGKDGLTTSQREEIKRETDEFITRVKGKISALERQIQADKNKERTADDIKVSSISAMETERSYNYVTYSIKADVDNKGDLGEVFIKLAGKNRDGHEIKSTYLTGIFDRRESRTLTTTTMVTYQQAMDIRTWEAISINKYKK